MRCDDLLGDVEAEAQAGGMGIGVSVVEAIKRVEELWYHGERNGSAFVVHRDFDPVGSAFGRYGHGGSAGTVLDCIADEIGYYLA